MADLREQLETALGATYRIERELGGGGMSRVFLATEAGLDRQVVIKVLPRDLAQLLNPERFEREIQIAAKLQHPHVVALLSAGQAGGVRYYVMPWIEGESLRARLAREPQPPLGETLRILRDTADGLAYAHARGIVHRDIKPENILLSGDHAVVTDFGVAKALTDAAGGGSGLTSVGLVIGTPAYMAPEQAAADPNVNAAADVYALGVIGYEMLAGEAPFQGGTPQALLAAHIAKTPVPLAERRPDLPVSLAALIDRCLAKQPEARPEAAAIVRELERLNTSAGTVVSRALPAPRFWDRRHGRVATVLVIVALAALGIRAWLGRGGSTPPAQPT
ncbi:MAG: serine/threonine protein kinase, partial [Gemmatimonadales bacterium]